MEMTKYDAMAREILNIHLELDEYVTNMQLADLDEDSDVVKANEKQYIARLATLLRERDANTPALPQSWEQAVREAAVATFGDLSACGVKAMPDLLECQRRIDVITAALAPLVGEVRERLANISSVDWDFINHHGVEKAMNMIIAESDAALALLGEKEEK